MPEKIHCLLGATVRSLRIEEGSVYIDMGRVALAIHNSYAIEEVGTGDVAQLNQLVGHSVKNLKSEEELLEVSFGDLLLKVDLNPDAWNGPEAAVLYEDSAPVVVWS